MNSRCLLFVMFFACSVTLADTYDEFIQDCQSYQTRAADNRRVWLHALHIRLEGYVSELAKPGGDGDQVVMERRIRLGFVANSKDAPAEEARVILTRGDLSDRKTFLDDFLSDLAAIWGESAYLSSLRDGSAVLGGSF